MHYISAHCFITVWNKIKESSNNQIPKGEQLRSKDDMKSVDRDAGFMSCEVNY